MCIAPDFCIHSARPDAEFMNRRCRSSRVWLLTFLTMMFVAGQRVRRESESVGVFAQVDKPCARWCGRLDEGTAVAPVGRRDCLRRSDTRPSLTAACHGASVVITTAVRPHHPRF